MKKLMIVAALAAVWTAQAKVAFAPVFGDKMVLQRDMPVRVWGTAAPGEAVKVSFAGQSRETKASALPRRTGRDAHRDDREAVGASRQDAACDGHRAEA